MSKDEGLKNKEIIGIVGEDTPEEEEVDSDGNVIERPNKKITTQQTEPDENRDDQPYIDLEEFTKGCKATGCDDIAKWKAFVAGRATKEMNDKAVMRKVYCYYFKPARPQGKTYVSMQEVDGF